MIYDNIFPAVFIDRPNRFTANIEIDGKHEICHVKNTGRCAELFIPGADIFVQKANNPNRKTKYDLISVYKNNMLINVDSQVPNRVVIEFLKSGALGQFSLIHPETVYRNSRFDIYAEKDSEKYFIEVKGVTLENNGEAKFPDAPTERGLKHINELITAVKDGYNAVVIFLIQMSEVHSFSPNYITHPQFAEALKCAKSYGVNVLAYSCNVTECSINIKSPVTVIL